MFDFGFRETRSSVCIPGSAVHRRLVRSASARALLDAFVASCVPLARRAFLSHAKSGRAEAFNLMRSRARRHNPSARRSFVSRARRAEVLVPIYNFKTAWKTRRRAGPSSCRGPRHPLRRHTRARSTCQRNGSSVRGCIGSRWLHTCAGYCARRIKVLRPMRSVRRDSRSERKTRIARGPRSGVHNWTPLRSSQECRNHIRSAAVLLLSHPDMLRRVIAAEKAKQSASKDDSKCSDGEKEGVDA